MFRGLIIALTLVSGAFGASAWTTDRAPITTLRLGAGQAEGSYYEIAARLTDQVNANTYDHRLMIFTDVTLGSVDTAVRVGTGGADLGIVQLDVLDDLAAGKSPAPGNVPLPLQPLFVVEEEDFLIVVREGKGLNSVKALSRAGLAIGTTGSGTQFTARKVLGVLGVNLNRSSVDTSSDISARAARFCGHEIDAAVFVISQPNPVVDRLITACGGRILGLTEAERVAVSAQSSAYTFVPSSSGSITSSQLKIPAVLTTSSRSDAEIDALMQSLFDPSKLTHARRLAWRSVPLETFKPAAITPLHPAAERFFAENPALAGVPAGQPD